MADQEDYSEELPAGADGATWPVQGVTTRKSGTWPVDGVAPAPGPGAAGQDPMAGTMVAAPPMAWPDNSRARAELTPPPPLAFDSTLPSSPPGSPSAPPAGALAAPLAAPYAPAVSPSTPPQVGALTIAASDLHAPAVMPPSPLPTPSEPPPSSRIRSKKGVSADQALSLAAILIALISLGILVTAIAALVLD